MENSTVEYAGFWKRFAAITIDGVIILFITAGFKWVFMDEIISQGQDDYLYGYSDSSGQLFYQKLADYAWSFYMLIIQWCYFAGMESSPLRATIGKLAVGIYVTGENGERINFAKATGRHFGKIISGLIIGIGYIMAAFNEKKQALHDTMSGCLVMSK
ncbi:MAG: RDD family protein [Bacteroidetes bacterium]|nr:RDD family protein [Bacteroidota bacterium]